jgi:hypothetical protein
LWLAARVLGSQPGPPVTTPSAFNGLRAKQAGVACAHDSFNALALLPFNANQFAAND